VDVVLGDELFGLEDVGGPVLVVGGPDVAVGLGGAGEAFDAAGLLGGVEGSEVGELHGDGGGSAAEVLGEGEDIGVGFVELAEGEVAVEVHGEEEFGGGPGSEHV